MPGFLDTMLWRSRDTIERHDAKDGSSVRYEFPLGFTIMADRQGVSFSGSSVNYDPGSLMEVQDAIKWAAAIHIAIRDKRGLPPQSELEGHLIANSKGDAAWWRGQYKDRIKDQNGVPALVILRRMVRERELTTHKLHSK